jgi:LacI family transcriptional regulator, galactose operon repressor
MIGTLVKKNGIAKHLQLRNILINILGDKFSIGQRFHSERELMRMFKVSSLTVSQAMKSLVSDGLVERRVGGGTFVMKSGDDVSLLAYDTVPFILYINIPPQNNIAGIDPLNWFISHEIRRGIVNSFNGKTKMLSTSDILTEIKKNRNNGCILVNPMESEGKAISTLTSKLVSIDVDSQLKPAPNCIKWECLSGIYQLMSYFEQSGHRKIALIAGRQKIHRNRIAGFRIGCETLNILCPPEYIKLVDSGTKEAGAEALLELLALGKDRPTAVFVDTDIKATGAVQAAQAAGLSVPGDISIAGFDDIPDAKSMNPPLTTVKVPYYEMGVQAVKRLLATPKTANYVPMKTELMIRESTGHAAG